MASILYYQFHSIVILNDFFSAVMYCSVLSTPCIQYDIRIIAYPAVAQLPRIMASGRIACS